MVYFIFYFFLWAFISADAEITGVDENTIGLVYLSVPLIAYVVIKLMAIARGVKISEFNTKTNVLILIGVLITVWALFHLYSFLTIN